MEPSSVILGQTIFFIESYTDDKVMSPVPLINEIQKRYGFVQVPRTLTDLDFNRGVSFLQGYFEGKIIQRLEVYNNGLLCEAAHETGLSERFLENLMSWALSEDFGLPVTHIRSKAFLSQVEIIVQQELEEALTAFDKVGATIAQCLSQYDQHTPQYALSGIRMHYDLMAHEMPRAGAFVFERRADTLHSEKKYFSSAPLRTSDHLDTLDILMKSLTRISKEKLHKL